MSDVDTEQAGPTVIRVVAEDAPDVITWGPWLEHIALRGDCVCGEAWIWRTEIDGRHITDRVGKHANCQAASTNGANVDDRP